MTPSAETYPAAEDGEGEGCCETVRKRKGRRPNENGVLTFIVAVGICALTNEAGFLPFRLRSSVAPC
jgi:hypothetical protein